ncbi:sn-glycerol-3-phosphate ABC transporter ATP-binding protein UgpC [Hoeflea sp. EC-HK425]|uniref:ABC transporter ATP-binding protein n=1 Tax=Hoeflea sp. EC-HK425 TaxID=2038388 RepID=UPI00125418A2|nr:sn-glycerol-3-phosphate ABC transporter ATP-binding protein UgpC [Hoeflea sp. EC-HK425]VVT27967.1 fused maltose transport subunit, ATP-binding component of ABC superfamily; regulatory protein [Hoeflea sp. EC-HK425]|tara:strand:+ start:804 stop:1904 length:1101 start_codon:yes stop_codon:yes gene_type:complete
MATVEIADLKKSFGAFPVVHGVSMDFKDGEFIILVGPSGCGKSTLLRMIAGLEDVTSGTISIGGKVVNTLSPKERNIAMVFQNYALYPQMTVAQNLGFSLELSKMPKAEIDVKVNESAEILGLAPLLDRKPSQLSGGQRQRVAMGRAIVRDPQVFLFDEPLSNLDANLRVKMRAEIKALHQRLGSTIVYVTHDQVEAMTMADRIVVLRSGVVEQIGTPLELYDFPKNMFVAGFLGSPAMNFLPGKLAADGSAALVLNNGESVALARRPDVVGDNDIVLGVRPQDISQDPDNGTAATVKVIEPTGADTHVLVELAGNEITCVLGARLDMKPGDQVRLSFKTPAAHFFDAKTEARLEAFSNENKGQQA